MGSIDLKPQAIFNYSASCFYRDPQRLTLELGCEKMIYSRFNLPLWLHDSILLTAKLILYKFPYYTCGICKNVNEHSQYTLCPLLEPFNVYGYFQTYPTINRLQCVAFGNSHDHSCTEIDMTQIVRDWCNNAMENNGILLSGKDTSPKIFYASNQYSISQMHPTLRLICKDAKILSTLQTVDCDVHISTPTLDGT